MTWEITKNVTSTQISTSQYRWISNVDILYRASWQVRNKVLLATGKERSRSRDSLDYFYNGRKSASRSSGTEYIFPPVSWIVTCMDNWRSSLRNIRFVASGSDQRFFISIIHLTTGLRNRFECHTRRSSRNGTRSLMSTRFSSSSQWIQTTSYASRFDGADQSGVVTRRETK